MPSSTSVCRSQVSGAIRHFWQKAFFLHLFLIRDLDCRDDFEFVGDEVMYIYVKPQFICP